VSTPVALARWRRARASKRACTVVCIGDSITYGPAMPHIGITRNWVTQLAYAIDSSSPHSGDGFRGLWHHDEWTSTGKWTQTKPMDPFDVAPFGKGLYSSGRVADQLTWTKPADLEVGAFELYMFAVPGAGRWQYRVDGGAWRGRREARETGVKLERILVRQSVTDRVELRGYDAEKPGITAIAGIRTYGSPHSEDWPNVVHNLGHQEQTLAQFCRRSAGDPFALLDLLRPDLVIVLFSNDVRFRDADRFGDALSRLISRVAPYADTLLVTPFEQRPPRVDCDATTIAGSTAVTSPTALFLHTDTGASLRGTNVARGARIASVQSTRHITMTLPAVGSSSVGDLMICGRRDMMVQAMYRGFAKAVAAAKGCAVVDLHDLWTRQFGPGWDGAYAAGLMHDGLHPTQRGHDHIAASVKERLELE